MNIRNSIITSLSLALLLSGCNVSDENTSGSSSSIEIMQNSLEKNEAVLESERNLLDAMSISARNMSEGEFIEDSLIRSVDELVNVYVPDYYVDDVLSSEKLQLSNLNQDVELLSLLHTFYLQANNSERALTFASLSDIVDALIVRIFTYIHDYLLEETEADAGELYDDLVTIIFDDKNSTVNNSSSSSLNTLILGDLEFSSSSISSSSVQSADAKTLNYKSYTGKNYPENDALDGSADSAFSPNKLIYSSYLKKYYVQYSKPIKDWNLAVGESAYVKFFVPPGVSSVGISFNDASLASQSIELADFGEFGVNYTVPYSFDYNAHTWLYKGAQSRVYSHTREASNLSKESSLVLVFHDKDNLYANVNLGQFDVGYYIAPEDLNTFKAWVNAQ